VNYQKKPMERNYIKHISPYLKALTPLEAIATPAAKKIEKGDFKAIIFDIYGTLLISASGDVDKAEYSSSMIRKALQGANFEILKDNKESFDAIYEIYNKCITSHLEMNSVDGRPYPEVDIIEVSKDALRLAKMMGIIKFKEDSDVMLFNFIFELQTNQVWPMPGMKKVINQLKDSKLTLGIVSNAQFYTPVIMNHFLNDKEVDSEVIEPFEEDLTTYSFKELRGKPDVALFETLLPSLAARNIKPEEALFVGNDMLKDIYTASQAGLKTAFFAGDHRSYRLREEDERCATLQADYVITELEQLLEIVGL